jgi:hypothetical protein
MNEPHPKLKHLTGWFAAGRETARSILLLSDGAFKLYVYLCLNADRRTGRLNVKHCDLVRALGKSQRSVVTYLSELRREGVCNTNPARNQHLGGEIEICDAFWPYEKAGPPATDTLAGYVERIRCLLRARSCVAASLTPADERLAAALFERKVTITEIEQAVLLGCARKYIALLNHESSDVIVSFNYFQNVIEEIRELNVPPQYWRHLQLRVDQLERQWTETKSATSRE